MDYRVGEQAWPIDYVLFSGPERLGQAIVPLADGTLRWSQLSFVRISLSIRHWRIQSQVVTQKLAQPGIKTKCLIIEGRAQISAHAPKHVEQAYQRSASFIRQYRRSERRITTVKRSRVLRWPAPCASLMS